MNNAITKTLFEICVTLPLSVNIDITNITVEESAHSQTLIPLSTGSMEISSGFLEHQEEDFSTSTNELQLAV